MFSFCTNWKFINSAVILNKYVRLIIVLTLSLVLFQLVLLYAMLKDDKRNWKISTRSRESRHLPDSRRPYLPGAGDDPDPEIRQKRAKIVEMTRHAWNGYVKYAWGANELRPVSRMPHSEGIFGARLFGATIVDAMDTLYLMGLYDEFQQGRDWIATHLNIDNLNVTLPVFELNIRVVGGLLSCYALTGDELFKNKAENVARNLLPAFDSATGLPYSFLNPMTNTTKNHPWLGDNYSVLSEIGTLHLEFQYLSDITGNSIYREKVQKIRKFLGRKKKRNGLYCSFIHPETGEWATPETVSVGSFADSFYEYLLKSWLQSGKTETEDRQMFDDAMTAIMDNIIRRSSNGMIYAATIHGSTFVHKMEMLDCYFGALLALGSVDAESQSLRSRYFKMAEEFADTCREAYRSSPIKLAPDEIDFNASCNNCETKITMAQSVKHDYLLRPETLESYFILWRITKNFKYREWAWEIVEAVELHCKSEAGYSGISNVYASNPIQDDLQQTFFIAEMMKYSYLLFSDELLIPLDEWVFNTEAHPLPVKGENMYYREK